MSHFHWMFHLQFHLSGQADLALPENKKEKMRNTNEGEGGIALQYHHNKLHTIITASQ